MTLQVRIVTPEGVSWEGEASAVRVPAIDGEMGFRTGHQPVLAVVRHGIIHVTPTSGGTQEVEVADVPMEEFLDDAPVVLEPGPAVGQH